MPRGRFPRVAGFLQNQNSMFSATQDERGSAERHAADDSSLPEHLQQWRTRFQHLMHVHGTSVPQTRTNLLRHREEITTANPGIDHVSAVHAHHGSNSARTTVDVRSSVHGVINSVMQRSTPHNLEFGQAVSTPSTGNLEQVLTHQQRLDLVRSQQRAIRRDRWEVIDTQEPVQRSSDEPFC